MKQSGSFKKIHFINILAFSVCFILLITGCQGGAESNPFSSRPVGSEDSCLVSPVSSTQTQPDISSQSVSESAPVSSSMTASQLEQIEKIRLIMFQAGSDGQVIYAFKDNKPLATGIFGDYSVSEKINADPKFCLYNIQYPYISFPAEPSIALSYSEIFGSKYTDAGYGWNFGGWIAFTDNGYPFNFPVTHHAYTADAQPTRTDWKEAFAPLIEEKTGYDEGYDISDTPLIITDVWRFDLDDDGIDEELVHACNQVKIPMTDQELKPASASTGIYDIMILFSTTLETTIISKGRSYIGEITEDESGSCRYENIKNRGSGTTETSVWQYDSAGNLILCPCYKYGEYWFYNSPIPIICDADGDGKPELIVVKSGDYWQVAVYKAGLESGELLWCENTMHP